MFEPIIIHNDEKVLTVDLHQKLLLYEIKASDKIPPPEVALKIDNAIIGTLGNILSIIGKAKSRKSFFKFSNSFYQIDILRFSYLNKSTIHHQNYVLFNFY